MAEHTLSLAPFGKQVVDDNQKIVAQCKTPELAALLAAAPDLLQTLKRLADATVVHKFMPYRVRIALNEARAAIARATEGVGRAKKEGR